MTRPGTDLTDVRTHFEFGKNWAEYADLIDQERLAAAIENVRSLVPRVAGKSFLDIGSGSGLFSLAALHLGAARVLAIDLDKDSVATTRKVLASQAENGRWTAERRSVFELSPDDLGTFDVVYSWGVLHHTGDMWRAIERSSAMVAPGGVFAFALYERTPLCGLWKIEKRAYMRAPPAIQGLVRALYVSLRHLARNLSGRTRSIEDRGMNLDHDAHDWLGGYPYQSTSGGEVHAFLGARGFQRVLERPVKIHLAGLLGSGCSEYVYERSAGRP